jgi:hypothetical protein
VPAVSGEAVTIESAGITVSENACDVICFGGPLSVTVTVKLDVPAAVGVPLITPLFDSFKPAGKAPMSAHV